MSRARVLLFTGRGKGKTTAALGMALRACGHGLRTLVIQFIKADASIGEIQAARHLPSLEIEQYGCGFLPASSSPKFAAHREAAERALRRAREALHSGRYALVILDEVCYAVHRRLLAEEARLRARGIGPGLVHPRAHRPRRVPQTAGAGGHRHGNAVHQARPARRAHGQEGVER